MYGAILGDIVGSSYEFTSHKIDPNLIGFTPKSQITDDSVMTLAVAKSIFNCPRSLDRGIVGDYSPD